MPSHYGKMPKAMPKEKSAPAAPKKAPSRKSKPKMPSREELGKMSVGALRQHLKDMGETVKGSSKMKKAALIDAIDDIHRRM